jgi:hypothetical protein
MVAEALLDGEAEAITRKVIEKALEGDATALALATPAAMISTNFTKKREK